MLASILRYVAISDIEVMIDGGNNCLIRLPADGDLVLDSPMRPFFGSSRLPGAQRSVWSAARAACPGLPNALGTLHTRYLTDKWRCNRTGQGTKHLEIEHQRATNQGWGLRDCAARLPTRRPRHGLLLFGWRPEPPRTAFASEPRGDRDQRREESSHPSLDNPSLLRQSATKANNEPVLKDST